MASVSSSTSSNNNSSLSGINGYGGLVSGLDTDSLVASLTSTEQTKIDKQNQQITKLEWQQSAYREIITKMQSFQSKYLDSLSKTDIRKSSSFNTISAAASTKAVSITTNSESYANNFVINSVEQLATGKQIKTATVSGDIKGSIDLRTAIAAEDYSDIDNLEGTTIGKLVGKNLSITIDGSTKVISFDESFVEDVFKDADGNTAAPTAESLAKAIQNKIDSSFGAGRATVAIDGEGKLTFDTASSSGISIYAVNSDMAPLETLGIENGSTNKIAINKQLSLMSGAFATALTGGREITEEKEPKADGTPQEPDVWQEYDFEINGVKFTAKSTDSIRSIMNEINNSKAGVQISYSEVTDTFSMTSTALGAGSEIKLSDTTGNFLEVLGINSSTATVTEGTNAIFNVDGVRVERSTNTNISVNGVFVTLNEVTNEATDITMSTDTSSMKDLVTNFVNDYNDLIELINKYRTEKREKDYAPLTSAQKEEMTDKQIEQWEEKAKAGILANDSTLNSLSSKLSELMYTSCNGFSFYQMGIESAGISGKGKLTIDEEKLDTALAKNCNQVKEFFLGEKGFGKALENVVNGAIKTSGVKGSRGSLIEKAGIGNTQSDTENNITDKIKSLKEYIAKLQDRLEQRQKYWWNKFSALETLVGQMDSYSSIISAYSSN